MYKGKLLLLIVSAALVYTEELEDNVKSNENYVSTENYEEVDKVISVKEFDEDKETSFVALAFEETERLVNQSKDASRVDDLKTETDTGSSSPFSPELDQEEAKADVKAWAENLDCSVSSLGAFKCEMIKKLIKRFMDTSDGIDLNKISLRIKNLIKKLEDSDTPIDDELRNMIQKYKKFL